MAAIALPSFLNQNPRARASTASSSNGEVDSLTGMSETLVGAAAFTLEQSRSSGEPKTYVSSINRAQQAYFLESADSLTGMSDIATDVAASTLDQRQSGVEAPRGNPGGSSRLVLRPTRAENVPILVDIILGIGPSNPPPPRSTPMLEGTPISFGSTDPSTQTMGGEGVVSWSIGFADVVRPSSSSTSFPIAPSDGRIRGTLLL